MRSTLFVVALILTLFVTSPGPSIAADLYVTTTVDTYDGTCDSHCSLRDAIVAANFEPATVDTIYLEAETYELTIPGVDEESSQTGDLNIRGNVSIIGKGPKRTIIDANGIDRVFSIGVAGVQTIVLRGLTIRGGWLESQAVLHGAGIRITEDEEDSVTIETCIVENNLSESSSSSYGGGIWANADANLTIRNSTIHSNSAYRGSGVYLQGYAAPTGVTIIERSTIYNNTSFSYSAVAAERANLDIDTSTISGNIALIGNGGVRNDKGTTSITWSTLSGNTGAQVDANSNEGGLVTLKGTIIDGGCWMQDATAIDSNRYNLESPANTCNLQNLNDKYNVADAMIDPLGMNGGPTPTHRPQAQSPVIDAQFFFTPDCTGSDQRGVSRPRDGEADPDTDAECDIGSVERVPGYIFFDGFECGYTTPWSDTTL